LCDGVRKPAYKSVSWTLAFIDGRSIFSIAEEESRKVIERIYRSLQNEKEILYPLGNGVPLDLLRRRSRKEK
jgi:hypothetical protein